MEWAGPAAHWWLVFGSFWSGIKLRRLDTASGKPSAADTTLYGWAAHSGGIEAPSIISHNGYYYPFRSYDACCKGVDSTYRTMVGRASVITGPYTDADGKAMLQGNAVQLLATDGRYIGPGGGTAFRDGSLYYYACHYYDGQMNGASELMLWPIDLEQRLARVRGSVVAMMRRASVSDEKRPPFLTIPEIAGRD
ncbi:MAG: family 43 glycosylhydrolase [Pseudomonadota bacterium]